MTATATQAWPAELLSVPAARRFVAGTLRGWGDAAMVDEASLVVSELVTNAVLHAGTPFSVTLDRMTDGVLLRVNDASAVQPRGRGADVLADGGRGMALVGSLTAGWGSTADGVGGKAVWALLQEPRPT